MGMFKINVFCYLKKKISLIIVKKNRYIAFNRLSASGHAFYRIRDK